MVKIKNKKALAKMMSSYELKDLYVDIEHEFIYSVDELEDEFEIIKEYGDDSEECKETTFDEYLAECLGKNGTLESVLDCQMDSLISFLRRAKHESIHGTRLIEQTSKGTP